MEQLSLKKYGWRCVLGMEVFYFLCLLYGAGLGSGRFITERATQLHHTLFELIPGFTWGSVASVIWGGVYLFALAWILAWYIVWMHNSSLIKNNLYEQSRLNN